MFCILLLFGCVNKEEKKYEQALSLMNEQKYETALPLLTELESIEYKDSKEKAEECRNQIAYSEAIIFFQNGDFESAGAKFDLVGKDYSDTQAYLDAIEIAQPYIGEFSYIDPAVDSMTYRGVVYRAPYKGNIFAPLDIKIKDGFYLSKNTTGDHKWNLRFPVNISGSIYHRAGNTRVNDTIEGSIDFSDAKKKEGYFYGDTIKEHIAITISMSGRQNQLTYFETKFSSDNKTALSNGSKACKFNKKE